MTDNSGLIRVKHLITGHEYNMALALAEVDDNVKILDKPTHGEHGGEIPPKHNIRASLPSGKALARQTAAQLGALAAELGLDVGAAPTKADLVALIEASQAGTAASAADNTEADEEAAS